MYQKLFLGALSYPKNLEIIALPVPELSGQTDKQTYTKSALYIDI